MVARLSLLLVVARLRYLLLLIRWQVQAISSPLPQNKSTYANNVFCIPVIWILFLYLYKSSTSPRSLSTAACGQSSTCRRARPPANPIAHLLEIEKDNYQLAEWKDNLFKHVLTKRQIVVTSTSMCKLHTLLLIFSGKIFFEKSRHLRSPWVQFHRTGAGRRGRDREGEGGEH